MTLFLFVIILFSIDCTSAFAQDDTISVNRRVMCDTEPVEYAVVAMLQPSDSSIVAYAMTNGNGHYSLKAASPLSEVLMKVSGFNIRRQVKRIKAVSQTLDFDVEKESITLHEVTVKARKLWGSRDTLNYLVSAYTRDHDRTIGDVLSHMPGITIGDNGIIKYQGTPINHFYIENLDMLQGRYSLATEGVKAEDVATVQVLENHEHVRALQDQQHSEQTAINLKLKDKKKGVWSPSADLGAGGDGDGMLWEATLQVMYFGKGRQHMFRYSGDNMGHGSDAATVHYGHYANGDNPHIVAIVGHGTPPVGNGLFGYRHSVNLNNLTKLSDSATVNYNFNYSHQLSRGSSFAQTTYLLPNGSQVLLTEDIADRTHTNSTDLQLTYEKNTSRRFLNNTLTLTGRWDEGRGTSSFVSQSLHYRSLGLSNRTRIVHRTGKGGGFEWTSTNSLSSTPQTLVVSGLSTSGDSARQDVRISAVSTANSFETLHNLRTHHWAISATAHLNANYISLTSELYPSISSLSTGNGHGNMDYLHATAGLGPVARYVNGDFQSTLRLPVAVTYTHLDNADNTGKSKKACVRLQPSFSLLWKATDNFTFNADANYTVSETPWARLIAATMMQNYRSVSRYLPSIDNSYGAGAHIKMSYKDIFKSFFAHLDGRWIRSWSDIAYGTTVDSEANTVIETIHMPNHSNHYTLTAYTRKDFNWHTTQVELSATATHGKSQLLRQSELTTYLTTGYTLHGALAFDIFKGYHMEYSATWQRNRSASSGHVTTYTELNQHGRLNLCLCPSRLFLNVNVNHTHNRSLASAKKDYIFLGSGLLFKLSKKVEMNLDGDNLTNIRTYSYRSLGDMEEYYTEYHLRPLSVILTAHISF